MSSDLTFDNTGIRIKVPTEFKESDLLLKVQPKKEKEVPVQKFRSFAITCMNGYLTVKGKNIKMIHLYDILIEHGMSKTIPIHVSLSPTTFTGFDFHPAAYNGPTVWYFEWNGVECSITSNHQTQHIIWIRVHDMTPGLGEQIIDELADELLKYWKDPVPNANLVVYTTQSTIHGYQWRQLCVKKHRDIDTIYIDSSIKDKLINQLSKFYELGDMYDRYGVTWKRVHLFHGPPGSGKTSTILALASIFGKHIAKLTLTPDLNSQSLEILFQTLPQNTFLLLEDVDALFTERKATGSIDFSTLLNCMDGLTTQRGMVLFMTTNHVTKLDQAFTRPGRVDFVLEFNLPGKQELAQALKTLGSQYAHEHEEFLEKCSNQMSIAGLQKHLFDCIMEEKKSILF
ncbi:AAA ATPase protein [Fadolivirus algeromassiliense]|jgi:hypothetical protein|uniref:AAA ATPase protein n=1 Tax=Fadolivirus FV1/VV64 TaxID=3070911 RepID=A0A7D3QWR3_9VIRU|nr:AAA ATPase protein [Fadolivirus algeromassiliense]QKF94859.1 AAA ATPase protein [Fadolivirus FV1/VV64]